MSDRTIDDDDRAPFAIDEWPYIQLADRREDRIRSVSAITWTEAS